MEEIKVGCRWIMALKFADDQAMMARSRYAARKHLGDFEGTPLILGLFLCIARLLQQEQIHVGF